jgi:SagB-type dehydrogenase family enzyme
LIAIRYHDATKHQFGRFSPSLGYLDWATQPDPFRRYEGAKLRALPRSSAAARVSYGSLYDRSVVAVPISDASVGEFLRCAMGLSAWKAYGQSRWALRVNPSSGNLHPTEAWLLRDGRVFHYAPLEHALEERCEFDAELSGTHSPPSGAAFLVGLTSIAWREAWKYGERAFRYCQHDIGHALGALRLSAAMLGWHLQVLPGWSDRQIATLFGLDRDSDFGAAEREEPECVAVVGPEFGIRKSGFDSGFGSALDVERLVDAAARGTWRGRANRLSARHVAWPMLSEVIGATRYAGIRDSESGIQQSGATRSTRVVAQTPNPDSRIPDPESREVLAREVILRRRSALGFTPEGVLRKDAFLAMLDRLRPPSPPWDAIDWPPQVHLALFVHRVQDVTPGVYAYLRHPSARDEWMRAMRAEFLWEPLAGASDRMFLLVPTDVARTAERLSCDQAIAGDGFFSLGMLAQFEAALHTRGESFYRRLFWECGMIGQVLYLEAESIGARATGIGCYYDDPVHELLGLSGHAWQSLYHFSMGLPIEDVRLRTEPGYAWEE